MTKSHIALVTVAAIAIGGFVLQRTGHFGAGHSVRLLGLEFSMRVEVRLPSRLPDGLGEPQCIVPDTVLVVAAPEGS